MNSVTHVLMCIVFMCSAPLGCFPSGALPRDAIDAVSQHSGGSAPHATSSSSPPKTNVGGLPDISFYSSAPLPLRMEVPFTGESEIVFELTPAPADPKLEQRVRSMVESELGRYPTGTLDCLDAVMIGGELTVAKNAGKGAYLLGIVFLTVGDEDLGWQTDERVVSTLHHEISSVLLHEHRSQLDEARFRAALPAGFRYAEDQGVRVWLQPLRGWEFDVSLGYLEAGLLKPWAMRCLEQDFNSYAEELFVRPPRLLRMFSPESLVGRKARVVRDFYIAIDPRFAELFEGEGSPILFQQTQPAGHADKAATSGAATSGAATTGAAAEAEQR